MAAATVTDEGNEKRRSRRHVKSASDVIEKAKVAASMDEVIREAANDVTNSSVMLSTACMRCGTRVYPAERISPALCIHKACFRCSSCDVTLTLHSYVIGGQGQSQGQVQEGDARGTTLYCQTHAPRTHRSTSINLHPEAIDIRNALRAQRIRDGRAFNHQVSTGENENID